jgi:cell division protein FtsQ
MTLRLRVLLATVVLLGVGGGGYLWLRESALVKVQHVEITGLTASDGDRVRATLENTATQMTTLHVSRQSLEDAVKPYPSVAGIKVTTDFPHTMRIQVIEQRAVAAIASGSYKRVPVTADGVVLNGVVADRDLPSIDVAAPAAGSKLTDKKLLKALAVAGAAPPELLERTEVLQFGSRGVVAALKNGPELLFGTDVEAAKKWEAAARVMAEPSAAGATYLDLRIPGRVAAGGLSPVVSPTPDPNPQAEAENGATLNG